MTTDLTEAITAAAVALYGPGLATRYRDYIARGVEAAAPLIAAAIAQHVEDTYRRWEHGECSRPRVERGEFLNDRDWCLQLIRASAGGTETSGEEEL